MIGNLSSNIDSLSGQTSSTVDLDAVENRPESLIPTSRLIEVNELTRGEGHHSYKLVHVFFLTKSRILVENSTVSCFESRKTVNFYHKNSQNV